MSFLAPWFLLGGLAVALPVVFHLIRRSTRERTPFSSLMFLFPTPPRLTKRSRLEHLLLLALRCLVLCLLALGFARPFFQRSASAPPPAEARRVLLLVDSSASMRRPNLWSDARDKVQSWLRQTKPGDQVALFTFDRQLRPLVSFAEWNATPAGNRSALLMSKLTSPGWSATRLDLALIEAAETLSDHTGKAATAPGEIVLIGDLQEGSHLEQLQGYVWPKQIRVAVEPLTPKIRGNASPQLLPPSDGGGAAPEGVRVRVSNAADSRHEQFKLGWASVAPSHFSGLPIEAYVPPGQSRAFTLPMPSQTPEITQVLLQGDEQDFDNLVFTVPPQKVRLSVLYCGGEKAEDPQQPLYFLKRAFQETRQQVVKLVAHPSNAPLLSSELDQVSLVILAEALPKEATLALREQMLSGKTLLCVIRNLAMEPTVANLAGVASLSLAEAHPPSYAMLADIDFRHPLFAPFADSRFSDFTKIHFWKYRRLDSTRIPDARILAGFDNGDPALLEVPIGKGALLILCSGWQPEDSQLALSTKFVPLLYSALERNGNTAPAPSFYQVGDPIPLPSGSDIKITGPDGAQLPWSAGQTNFSATLVPGVYTVASGDSVRRFAVNLDPLESRTPPVSVEELEHLGLPLAKLNPGLNPPERTATRLQNAELERRQHLWRWLLLVAVGVLLAETWLSGRAVRRLTAPVESVPRSPEAEGAFR